MKDIGSLTISLTLLLWFTQQVVKHHTAVHSFHPPNSSTHGIEVEKKFKKKKQNTTCGLS